MNTQISIQKHNIPRVIHYCWFGGKKKPRLATDCINSWKEHLYGYKFKEWNESNFDINCNEYVKEAYKAKKWAFITDYVRLYVLLHEGGIYMDTDTEVLKPLDPFLNLPAFSGYESSAHVATCIIGAEKGNKFIADLLKHYDTAHFIKADGEIDYTTNVDIITAHMKKMGLRCNNTKQTFPNLITIFPSDFFCAKDFQYGELTITENTFCIHHFAGSWLPQNNISLTKRITNTIRSIGRFFMAKICILNIYRRIRYPYLYSNKK